MAQTGAPGEQGLSGKKRSTRNEATQVLTCHDDGHWLLRGARWHIPKQGDPTRCEVLGCERLMGQRQAPEFDDVDADLQDGEECRDPSPSAPSTA